MNIATEKFLSEIDALAEQRRREITESADELQISGTKYYVSQDGDDENDGRSPESAWKTLKKVNESALMRGDAVLFCRGDIFRGYIRAQSGVSYGAYGEGDKPKFFGGDKNLADQELWELYDAEHNIWLLREKILDCGTLVFDGGRAHSRKLIPSYSGGRFVCRDNPEIPFDVSLHMTRDLDIFCHYDERLTADGGEPIPLIDDECYGRLYLRCDKGNPAKVFSDIEALPHRSMIQVGDCDNVRVDNLCLKYIGIHAVAASGQVEGLHVSNCEIGWIGGCIQFYFGSDPNFPRGRGNVTRYGNGVEIYGGCNRYVVENCYVYQCYDAGITHQMNTGRGFYRMENIRYSGNLIENCVYSIEYFLDKSKENESYIKGCEIKDNILRFSGYGWGQQRPNIDTPAHIKSWNHDNEASDFVLRGNIFDRSAYRLLHLVAREQGSLPKLEGNIYIQTLGGTLGQFGGCERGEPQMQIFDECAEDYIKKTLGDGDAKVVFVE